MTMLDDQVDDLLRQFRADEAAIDDPLRQRMWEEVARTAASGPVPLRPARPRLRGRRVLAAAAALAVAALGGALAGRATGDQAEPVAAGRAEQAAPATVGAPIPTIDELVAAAAGASVPVLGSGPDVAYAHVVTSDITRTPGTVDAVGQRETWVAADGSGRRRSFGLGAGTTADDTYTQPGALLLGGVAPAIAVRLTADPTEVLAALVPDDPDIDARDRAVSMVDLLAQPGVPAAGRAGVLRALSRLGFTTGPGATDDTVRIVGRGADGAVVEAEVLRAGAVVTVRTTTEADGTVRTTSWSQVDLRPRTG